MRRKGLGCARGVLACVVTWTFLSSPARAADSLLDVLRAKGVLTPQECERLGATELPAGQRAALIEVLRAKGILSGDEVARLAAAPPAAPPKAEKAPVALPQVGYDEGFFVRSEDGRFGLKVGGRVASNFFFYEPDIMRRNTEAIDRARLGVDATFYKYFRARLEYDLAFSQGLRDAFIAASPSPAFSLQVGQFKVPFSYEALRSKKYIDFVERSAVTASTVSPSRDIGVMASGRLWDDLVQYQLAVMNGTGQNRTDTNGDKDVIGRLVVFPFARGGPEHLRGLNLGGAMTYGREAKEVVTSSSGKTSLVNNSIAGVSPLGFTFFPAMPVRGDRLRTGGHLAWFDGPYSVSAEYIRVSEDRAGLGTGKADLPSLETAGGYVGGTWMLTGETKPPNARVRPRRPLWDGERPGWGAFEVAARYDVLDIGVEDLPEREGNRYDGAMAGINWYPNEFLRVSVDYVYSHFREVGKGISMNPTKRAASAVLGRVQLEF